MKILYIIPSYSIDWGGPSKVVHDLARILSVKGIDIDIVATVSKTDKLHPLPRNVNLYKFNRSWLQKFWVGCSMDLVKFLKVNINNYDLIHIHELWHFPHFAAYITNKAVPYAVTVHGVLEPWCLRNKQRRKKIYSFLIQKRILQNATFVHILTNAEMQYVTNYCDMPTDKIVRIPNGVDLNEIKATQCANLLLDQYPKLKGRKYILFMSRLNKKKGLDLLIQSFKLILSDYRDLILVIAGPDSDDYLKLIEKQLSELGLLDNVIITGMLTGQLKYDTLFGASCFVLPSYSEGFPMVVIEAMACGTPVVVSNKVGIDEEIRRKKAGIVVETNVESLYHGIRKLLDDSNLGRAVGGNGKQLVKDHYEINNIADMMISAYQKAIEGTKTAHVHPRS